MTDGNHFIDEVSEELRRERLFGAMRKYGWIAIALVILLVAGASWYEWQRAQTRADARAFGDRIVTALDNQDVDARRAALLEIDAEGTRRALIAMLAADTLDTEEARTRTAELLEEVAADDALPQLYREMAVLKASMLQLPTAAPQEVIDRLEPLTVPGAPYRLLALEQQALARLKLGETEAALDGLRAILAEASVPRDLEGRVRQLIVALGGSTEAT